MVTKIQKWGNSQGLRLALNVLDCAHLAVGDEVEICAKDGQIVITPLRRVRGKRDLGELLQRIPKDYRPGEVDWGKPSGGETW